MPATGIRGAVPDTLPCPVCLPDDEGNVARHKIAVRLGALPLLVCPRMNGNVMRFTSAWSVALVGESVPLPLPASAPEAKRGRKGRGRK